jgi:hypothetical protein
LIPCPVGIFEIPGFRGQPLKRQTTLLDITSTGISLKMLGLSLNLTSIPDIRLPFMASCIVLFQSNRSGQQPGESGCPCRQFFGHQYVQYSASMAADYTNPPDISRRSVLSAATTRPSIAHRRPGRRGRRTPPSRQHRSQRGYYSVRVYARGSRAYTGGGSDGRARGAHKITKNLSARLFCQIRMPIGCWPRRLFRVGRRLTAFAG